MTPDWARWACRHGIYSAMYFVHLVGPMTTADGSTPAPPCHPEFVAVPS